jgi:hypothetical protein
MGVEVGSGIGVSEKRGWPQTRIEKAVVSDGTPEDFKSLSTNMAATSAQAGRHSEAKIITIRR